MAYQTDPQSAPAVDTSKDRSAFARAVSYLSYKPLALWTTYFCAVALGVLLVVMIVLLGLFTDLMVHRGLMPSYRELSFGGQQIVDDKWASLSVEERMSLLNQLRNDESGNRAVALKDPESEEGSTELTLPDRDVIWRAHLCDRLKERVSDEAANVVRDEEKYNRPHGLLSLVARSDLHGKFYAPLLGWFAGWNSWTWTGAERTVFAPYLTGLLLLGLFVVLLRAGLTVLMQDVASRATNEAASRLRRAVYHHTFRLGTLAFRALGPSEAVTVFTRHVEAVHDALQARITTMTREPFKLVLLILLALVLKFWLAVAFMLFALLVWMVGGQIAVHFRRQGKLATNEASEQLTLIRESLMMMRLVKCYLMELFNQSRVERQLGTLAETQQRRARGEAIFRPMLILMGMVAAVILLYVTGLIVLYGSFEVASAIMMAVALIALYSPLQQILETRKIMRRGRDSAVQLFRFLDRPGDVGQVVGAEFLPTPSKQIELDNVSLRESGSGRTLLKDVSLSIKVGQRIGLVGADDLEKHAFVYLLPRLLDPTSGEIRIDDHSLRWITLDSLRDKIGTVLMHNLIFHDTVGNNIGCGDSAFTLPKIIESAKMARAHQFISKLPQGYDTQIGELHFALTLSQQYRIALARAILRDPPIMVIEEPEHPFKDEVKALIDDVFARFLPGRTVIFLPHRISTIRSCDRLYLLHKGQIEAAGDHKQLLSTNKLYRHLHYLEFNEMAELV